MAGGKLIRTTFRKEPDTGEASAKKERIKCHTDREDLLTEENWNKQEKCVIKIEDTLRKTQYSLSWQKI